MIILKTKTLLMSILAELAECIVNKISHYLVDLYLVSWNMLINVIVVGLLHLRLHICLFLKRNEIKYQFLKRDSWQKCCIRYYHIINTSIYLCVHFLNLLFCIFFNIILSYCYSLVYILNLIRKYQKGCTNNVYVNYCLWMWNLFFLHLLIMNKNNFVLKQRKQIHTDKTKLYLINIYFR